MGSCKYADVIVDISHEKLDKPFTYRIPEELISEVSVGMPVNIPFGNAHKLKTGYVVDVRENPDIDYDVSRIKDIESVASKKVGVIDDLMELAVWMKDRYGCTFARCLKTVLPVKKQIKQRTKENPVKDNRREYRIHEPNEWQKKAIDKFNADFDAENAETYLLYGVTGSGKTDAYMHMISHVVSKGKKVILLIPEISLTYQTIDRLYGTFGDRIAIIHSKLSPGERYEQFRRCESGEADIIIGPRSAVFAPFDNIGLIVIDEEHDGAYKNENIPRYHTIDVARKRASMHGASLILASATPSPDTYSRALSGEYVLLKLPERTAGAMVPAVEVIDMRQEMLDGNRSIFSKRLQELISDRLQKKEQTILFMNRRGYSNFVSCRSCGNAIKCPHCDVSLTLHRGYRMVCHYCGYEIPKPDVCPSCGSKYIAEFGTGTQKLETMTRKMFPEARVARLDTDSAQGKKSAENILSDFAEGKIDILIGTQMVVKGHDYHNVTLVGIMAADTSLYVSDYASGEKTYELISQASGRAGRGKKNGTVIVQTYKPEHYAIANAARGDYDAYYESEYAFRKLLHYPPALHILTVQLSSTDEDELNRICDVFKISVMSLAEKYKAELIGPVNAGIYKVHDYFRKLTYIKHSDYDILLKIKKEAEQELKDKGIACSVLCDFT